MGLQSRGELRPDRACSLGSIRLPRPILGDRPRVALTLLDAPDLRPSRTPSRTYSESELFLGGAARARRTPGEQTGPGRIGISLYDRGGVAPSGIHGRVVPLNRSIAQPQVPPLWQADDDVGEGGCLNTGDPCIWR